MKQIGRRTWAIDWEARSRGGAAYTADVAPADALAGAILRSPYPHATVDGIDTAAAEKMPGVRAVITAQNFRPGARYFHEMCFDRPPLADGVVRFVGQEVAAVAADTREQALAALAAIHVRYTPLPAPLTVEQALAPGAAQLHEPGPPPGMPPGSDHDHEHATGDEHGHGDSSAHAEGPPSDAHGAPPADAHGGPPAMPQIANVRRGGHMRLGDLDKGRAEGTITVSGRFRFPQQTHVCMETHRTVADWQEGRLHLWTSTASPRFVQFEAAGILGIAPPQVVVHEVAVGGSFGAKMTITEHEVLAAALAREAGRPVLITLTREEEFSATKSRHAFDVDLTLRADASGRVRTIEANMTVDSGAYLHSAASVMGASFGPLTGMYRADGAEISAQVVDTAKLPAGAYRGYGAPQTTYPLEMLMDELAEKLGRDPIDLRIQNAYRSNDQGLWGKLGGVGLVDCYEAVREAIGWEHEKANRKPGRGIGVAGAEEISGAHGMPGSNVCGGVVNLHADGRLVVRFGGSDAGTGQKTILAQIAAEELGVPFDRIRVISMDTDQTPHDLGAWSSRGTHYTGHAIRQTSREFADRLKKLAAERLGTGDITLEDGFARGGNGEVPLADLVAISNEAVDGVLTHESTFVEINVEMLNPAKPTKFTATHNYGAHAAIVEVDEKTGKVRLVDYAAANDSGTALNPMMLEGQIIGGAVQGIGSALGEEVIFEQGKVVNPAYLHYAMPRAADVPRIRPVMAPVPDELGPYGAKAVGEVSILSPGPAIANAVYDAIGVRIRTLPITPDKIINALAERAGRKRVFNIWARPSRWWIALVRAMYPLSLLKLLHNRQMALHDQAEPPAPPLKAVETPASIEGLVAALGPDASVLGGGTDLQLRRRTNLHMPDRLVSVVKVAELKQLSVPETGPIVIGAGVTLSRLAAAIKARIPAVADTIEEIASPQIRNVATVAGNLRQEKRCWFFRNGFNCFKRRGGLAPCYAIEGDHRFYHAAIDGHRCQAVTPSDLATILVALDAMVTITSPNGVRDVALGALYTGPGEMDGLGERDVITRITIPAEAAARQTSFRKLNLWKGDFAIASAAVSVALDGEGRCAEARICLGAVAPVPWRARATERGLVGQKVTAARLRTLLDAELDARGHPLKRNEWKLDAVAGLAERAVEAL